MDATALPDTSQVLPDSHCLLGGEHSNGSYPPLPTGLGPQTWTRGKGLLQDCVCRLEAVLLTIRNRLLSRRVASQRTPPGRSWFPSCSRLQPIFYRGAFGVMFGSVKEQSHWGPKMMALEKNSEVSQLNSLIDREDN